MNNYSLKSFLDDFSAYCKRNNEKRPIAYQLWRSLINLTKKDSNAYCYFLKNPYKKIKTFLGIFWAAHESFCLYISDCSSVTGDLNIFIDECCNNIYLDKEEYRGWDEFISEAISKYGITLWPAEKFIKLIGSNTATTIENNSLNISNMDYIKYNTNSKMLNNNYTSTGQLKYNTNLEMPNSNYLTSEKEVNMMDTSKMISFDFGPAGPAFSLSPYGVAAFMGDNWVVYNANEGSMMNVNVFNFRMNKFIYKMPVTISALAPGDLVIHQKIPMFVKSVDNEKGTVEAINYRDCTIANILPVKSPFGFNFITKIVSLIDMSKINPDTNNPFGNMLPLMLLGDQEDSKTDPLLLCMMMQGGQMDFSNPMMMYFMLQGDNNNDNLLPLMFMMQNK